MRVCRVEEEERRKLGAFLRVKLVRKKFIVKFCFVINLKKKKRIFL